MRALRRAAKSLRNALLLIYTRTYAWSKGVRVGRGTVIHPGARMISNGGSIIIGDGCEFLPGSVVATYGGHVRIGDNVSVNYHSILYGHGGLVVGNDVRIAAHVVVIPANHGMDPKSPVRGQPLSCRGIHIGNDVWLAAGARLLDGAILPDGCVVAAGAVVLPALSTEPYGIYGGVPARRIGSRLDGR